MKTIKHKIIIFLGVLISASCGGEEKLKSEIKNSAATIKNTAKVAKESDNLQKSMTDLLSKTPLTKEQFESCHPDLTIFI